MPLLFGAAACGGDDDDDAGAFCEAEIELESAIGAEDAEAIGPAFEAVSDAAPEDIADAVDTAVAEAERFLAEDSDPTPKFEAAYAEMMTFMKEECGYTDLALTTTEYNFAGLPGEVDAGPAVVTIENLGQEFHEVALMRINDDVTESVEELLALPQEEAEAKVANVASGFAPPGATGYTAADLTPGRYVAMCFVPQGFTMEAMEQMESGGAEPDGQPHAMLGMVHEFTVA